MRLLFLTYGPQSGVTESVSRALAAAGASVRTHDVLDGFLWRVRAGRTVLPNARPGVVRAVAESMLRHGRGWKALYLHTAWTFDRLSRRAGEEVRRLRPDVVLQSGVLFAPGAHAEVPYYLYLDHTRALGERYEPLPGLPPPFPEDPAWRARERSVYRNAVAIFTMSEIVRRSLLDDYGVDPTRVITVGAGPNVEPDAPDPGTPRDPALLFVGRTFVPKGGPELLAAFELVRDRHPDLELWLVTRDAPARLPPGARAFGLLDRPALARRYARAGAFVLPTLRECFGISFLEAMAFGLPVVGTRIEAIPEIVAEGETGLLVPPRDVGALTRALETLLRDPERARRMGAAGRARVAARFGWDRVAARMLAAMSPEPDLRRRRIGARAG
jgi:starch synthase